MLTSPAQIRKFLKDVEYPVKKQDLIEQAKKNNASNEVLQDLNRIPDKEYTSAIDIDREFESI